MKTFIIVSLIIFAVIAVSVAFAKAKGVCGSPDARAEWMVNRVAGKLNLDDDQKQKLGAFRDTLMEIRGTFVESRSTGRNVLKEMLALPTLDRSRAQLLLDERHSAFSQHSPELVASFADFTDNLNEEQRSKLIAWLDRRHFGHRHGHM